MAALHTPAGAAGKEAMDCGARFGAPDDRLRVPTIAPMRELADPLRAGRRRGMRLRQTLDGVVEQSLEIAGDALVVVSGRRHHDRDALNEFPMLFVGAGFRPTAECRNRQRRDFSLRCAGHFALHAAQAPSYDTMK
jgi:hypothetical protein